MLAMALSANATGKNVQMWIFDNCVPSGVAPIVKIIQGFVWMGVQSVRKKDRQ